ncbi:MAG: hypothetical protein AB1634_09315 [Thermodesulfobacteriota bacterium]
MHPLKTAGSAAVVAAALCLLAFPGPAAAYFTDDSLVRVVYDSRGSGEVATDLGQVRDLVSQVNLRVGYGPDAFSLEMFDHPGYGQASWADLRVGYLAGGLAADGIWLPGFGGRLETSQVGDVQREMGTVLDFYAQFGTATVGPGGSSSHSFAYLLSSVSGQVSLQSLQNRGYVDQYLFYWSAAEAGEGVQVAVLRTMADGSTIINPVPVPASGLLLLGSSLGLGGIRARRRQA